MIPKLTQCYEKKLSVSKEKRDDLLKLCNDGITPQKFHDEYIILHSDFTINDVLPQTDEEDCVSLESD